MAAIEVEGLTKRFGEQTVLDGIDLEVQPGTIFALLGPNGAGKTTLIGILSTLLLPDRGAARVAGHDVVREPAAVRMAIGVTGQSAAVDDLLTGDENVRLFARLSGYDARAARRLATALLDRFGLGEASRKRVGTYSGGMRRRLDLSLGLIRRPEIVFLDEPTTGLDTLSRRALWDAIRELAADGATVLLTTQYLEEADQLADRIAVLDRGRIVADGTAAELKALVGGEVVTLSTPDGELLAELPTDGTAAGLRAALETLGDRAADGIVGIRQPSLDDVFLHLTAPVR